MLGKPIVDGPARRPNRYLLVRCGFVDSDRAGGYGSAADGAENDTTKVYNGQRASVSAS